MRQKKHLEIIFQGVIFGQRRWLKHRRVEIEWKREKFAKKLNPIRFFSERKKHSIWVQFGASINQNKVLSILRKIILKLKNSIH